MTPRDVVVYSSHTMSLQEWAQVLISSDQVDTMQRAVQPQSNLHVHTIVEHPNQEGDTSNCVLMSLLN